MSEKRLSALKFWNKKEREQLRRQEAEFAEAQLQAQWKRQAEDHQREAAEREAAAARERAAREATQRQLELQRQLEQMRYDNAMKEKLLEQEKMKWARAESERADRERAARERAEAARLEAEQRRAEELRRKEEKRLKLVEQRQNVTPDSLRNLRELIRTRYQLDVEIWDLRGSRIPDRPLVEEKMVKADAVLLEIYYIVRAWEGTRKLWSEKEWEQAMEIHERLMAGGKRMWSRDPPWEDL